MRTFLGEGSVGIKRPSQQRGHVELVSYLTIQFLGKPLGGSLPVFSARSFASNWQLALLKAADS